VPLLTQTKLANLTTTCCVVSQIIQEVFDTKIQYTSKHLKAHRSVIFSKDFLEGLLPPVFTTHCFSVKYLKHGGRNYCRQNGITVMPRLNNLYAYIINISWS